MSDDAPILPDPIPPCHRHEDVVEHIEGCKALAAVLHIGLLNEDITIEPEDLQVFTRVLWWQLSVATRMTRDLADGVHGAQMREEDRRCRG